MVGHPFTSGRSVLGVVRGRQTRSGAGLLHARRMAQSGRKGPFVGYVVVAVLMGLSMFFSASMKLTQ